MTSTTLSGKAASVLSLQKQITRTRIWVIALASLLSFIYYGIAPAMIFSATVSNTTSADRAAEMKYVAAAFYSFNNPIGIAGALILAWVLGIQGFSWLYKMRSVVFFESLPVSKNTRFWAISLNGFFIAGTVTMIGNILAMIICTVFGGASAGFFTMMILEWVRLMILFFATYAISILCAVIAGNVVIATMLIGFVNIIELCARTFIVSLASMYFKTYHAADDNDMMMPKITPAFLEIRRGMLFDIISDPKEVLTTKKVLSFFGSVLTDEFIIIALGVAALCLAWFAYKRRTAEAATGSIAFPWVEIGLKIIILFVTGITTWMMTDSILRVGESNSISAVTVVFTAVCILIAGIVCESIFDMNVRSALKRWQIIPAVFAAVVLVCCVYVFDLVGYDSYVPQEADIESYAIFPNNNDADLPIKARYKGYYDMEKYLAENMKLVDVGSIVEVADAGMKFTVEHGDEYTATDSYSSNYALGVTVLYRLKNGKKVWREMVLTPETFGKTQGSASGSKDSNPFDAIIQSDEYKDVYFDIDRLKEMIDSDNIRSASLTYTVWTDDESEEEKDKTINDKKKVIDFLDIYEKSLDHITLETLVNSGKETKATVYVDLTDKKQEGNGVEYNIYRGDKDVISWLEREV